MRPLLPSLRSAVSASSLLLTVACVPHAPQTGPKPDAAGIRERRELMLDMLQFHAATYRQYSRYSHELPNGLRVRQALRGGAVLTTDGQVIALIWPANAKGPSCRAMIGPTQPTRWQCLDLTGAVVLDEAIQAP